MTAATAQWTEKRLSVRLSRGGAAAPHRRATAAGEPPPAAEEGILVVRRLMSAVIAHVIERASLRAAIAFDQAAVLGHAAMHRAQLLVQAAHAFELFLQLFVNHGRLLPG
jgi:hypothetical protein